jgi:hypothetical protein
MLDAFQGMKQEFVFVLMIVGITAVFVTVISVISVVATAWRKSRRDEMMYELKREMLERGMSAEDIERVIRAESPTFTLPSVIATPWWGCSHKGAPLHPAPTAPGR